MRHPLTPRPDRRYRHHRCHQVLFQWMGRFWEQSAASQRQTVTEVGPLGFPLWMGRCSRVPARPRVAIPQLLAALGTHCVEGPETAAARIAVRCIARLWVLAPSTEARLPLPRFGLAARLALLREVALDTELCPAAATDAKCRAFRHALASHVARQARPQVLAAATTALRDGPPVQHAAAFHALRAWASTAAALLPPPPCDQAVAAAAAAGGEPLLDTAHQFHRALEAACSAVGADDERAALRIGALAPVLGPALHGATAGLDAAEDGPEPCDAGAADAAADCIVDALAWHSPEEAFLAVEGDDADLADLAAVRGIARELGLRVGAIAAAAGQHAPTARQRRALRAASKLVGALLEGHSHVTLCSQEALAAARGEAGAASRAKEEAQALVTATCALLTGPWDEGAGSALVLVSGCSQAIFRAISAAADEAQGATHPASGPDPSPAVAVACELVDAVAARAVAAPSGDAAQQYNSQPGGRRGAGEVRGSAQGACAASLLPCSHAASDSPRYCRSSRRWPRRSCGAASRTPLTPTARCRCAPSALWTRWRRPPSCPASRSGCWPVWAVSSPAQCLHQVRRRRALEPCTRG